MTHKDTIDIVAEATDLRRRLKETKIIADYYRERMHDAERQVATMELSEKLKALEPLLTPRAKLEWIKTLDKMPGNGDAVLTADRRQHGSSYCAVQDTVVALMRYAVNGCCWIDRDGIAARRPAYWMPLPPLPEEEK